MSCSTRSAHRPARHRLLLAGRRKVLTAASPTFALADARHSTTLDDHHVHLRVQALGWHRQRHCARRAPPRVTRLVGRDDHSTDLVISGTTWASAHSRTTPGRWRRLQVQLPLTRAGRCVPPAPYPRRAGRSRGAQHRGRCLPIADERLASTDARRQQECPQRDQAIVLVDARNERASFSVHVLNGLRVLAWEMQATSSRVRRDAVSQDGLSERLAQDLISHADCTRTKPTSAVLTTLGLERGAACGERAHQTTATLGASGHRASASTCWSTEAVVDSLWSNAYGSATSVDAGGSTRRECIVGRRRPPQSRQVNPQLPQRAKSLGRRPASRARACDDAQGGAAPGRRRERQRGTRAPTG